MCQKVIETYQQTFSCSSNTLQATFNFTRVMKQKPEQKFRLKLVYFSNLQNISTPGLWFLKYGYGKCNFQEVNAQGVKTNENNDFFLGTFSDNAAENNLFEMLVDEIYVTPFTIYNTDKVSASAPTKFLVSFQIELLEN